MKLLIIIGLAAATLTACTQTATKREIAERTAEEAFVAGRFEDAANAIEPLAQKGDSDAEFSLGTLILTGKVPTKTVGQPAEATGIEWILRAAQHGSHDAKVFISNAYARGDYGLRKDENLAKQWADRAHSDPGEPHGEPPH